MAKFVSKRKVTQKLNHVLQVEIIESRVLDETDQNPHQLSLIHALDDNIQQNQLNSSVIIERFDRQGLETLKNQKYFKNKHEKRYQSFDLQNLPVKNNQIALYPQELRASQQKEQKIQLLFSKRLRSFNSAYNGNELEQIKRENHLIRQKNLKHMLSVGEKKNDGIASFTSKNLSMIRTTQLLNEKQQIKSLDLSNLQKDFSDTFMKSSVIKMQNYIMSKLPICQECLSSKNIVKYNSQFDCINNCHSIKGMKDGTKQNQQKYKFKAPLLGILFELQNFEKNQKKKNQNPFFDLLEQINSEIQKIESYLEQLHDLKTRISNINDMRKQHQTIFRGTKEKLTNFLKEDVINNSTFFKSRTSSLINSVYLSQQQSQNKVLDHKKQDFSAKIKEYISQYLLDEIRAWSHIQLDDFKCSPRLYELLLKQIPSYLLPPFNNIIPMLLPLTSNFALKPLTIMTSKPTPFIFNAQQNTCLLSLNNVNWMVDGPITLPQFQYIKNLCIKFQGKRSYKQLSELFSKIPETIEQIEFYYDCKLNSHPSSEEFPLLSKLCSFKMCKKLRIEIQNYNYGNLKDLLEMSKIISKKKQLTIIIKKNIYARGYRFKKTQESQLGLQSLIQEDIQTQKNQNQESINLFINNIIKKIGKGIVKLHLEIALPINKEHLYHYLILGGYLKLFEFKLEVIQDNQTNDRQNRLMQIQQRQKESVTQKVLKRMLFRKKWIIDCLQNHQKKKLLSTDAIKNAIFGIILGR